MAMKKIKKGTWIAFSVGLVVLIAICCGVNHFINKINGATTAQIEARKRANEAVDQTTRELTKEAQWHQDMMSQPVTVTNSDGEEVTYTPKAEPCINSNQ